MHKEKLQDKIERLEKELEQAKEELKRTSERFVPKINEKYYFLKNDYEIGEDRFCAGSSIDRTRYENYNCFETKEEAQREASKILIRRKLEAIAKRLNNGEEIDWNNYNQIKYHITYNFEKACLNYVINYKCKDAGCVYCINSNFISEAIKEINEQELIDYIKGE